MPKSQAVLAVESVISSLWGKMVGWQSTKGWRASTFSADDIVQTAAMKFYKFAVAGKYDGKSESELEQVFSGLVRQAGFHLFKSSKAEKFADYEIDGLSPLVASGSHTDAVEAEEFLQAAYGDDWWIAEAQIAGESLNELAASGRAGMGVTSIKKRARAAAERARELVAN